MDKIDFTVNGERFVLSGSEVSPSTSLCDYLRDHLGLHGTKAMCNEGGCGTCVVSVSRTHPVTKEKKEFSANSCLVHILSCHQWDITTIEGLGNHRDGYHPLQRRLAEYNGTQCGYCTPGWIMNMHSLQRSSENLNSRQIERSFGGHICRCTGYRPILDAFKTFAKPTESVQDIEDLNKLKCKMDCDEESCSSKDLNDLKEVEVGGNRWFKAYTIDDVLKVLLREGGNYQLVAGNTGKGVYPYDEEPKIYIDITSIDELQTITTKKYLIIGAGISLTEFMRICEQKCKEHRSFSYLNKFLEHLELVAHVSVRNIGTIGGNLALKNKHHDFDSDVFLLLETVGACVTIIDTNKLKITMNMKEFMATDLTNKLILNVVLPRLSLNNLIQTYKIMPCGQNARAIINAGFLFQIDKDNKVLASHIVYSNIGPNFIHAEATEGLLIGKNLFSENVLMKALHTLEKELVPVKTPLEISPFCRKYIGAGLFYKAILSLAPSVNPRYKTGGLVLSRPVSQGTQSYETDKLLWPLNEPVMKLESLLQCSGEARYVADRHHSPRDVHVAFVLSTICLGKIKSFNAVEAMKLDGVIAFFTGKDIPGRNSFTPKEIPWIYKDEEILATKVSYYGQPIAIVVANDHKLAVKAAGLVKVVYKISKKQPILNIVEAYMAPDKDIRIREESSIKSNDRGTDVTEIIKGTFTIPEQYHYAMETQSCTVSNTRRGLVIRSATQWMDIVQAAVAKSLDLPMNSITVEVSRVGGGFGAKETRSALIACACALAAYKLNRTATLVLPLTHNMAVIGKGQECYAEYEVAINQNGLIQHAKLNYYSDNGCSFNDSAASFITDVITNLYDISRWDVTGYSVRTDKASNTSCRAPGATEAAAIMEHIMERIAAVTKKDSSDIKLLHIIKDHEDIKTMIDTFKIESQYEERKAEIAAYNTANAWTKKSIKTSIMSFPVYYCGNYPVTIAVHHVDGTILISHGGMEMGQGINTKVAQVCAHTLKVPLNIIKIKGADSFISPNVYASSASMTSDCVTFATVKACEELLKRLEPVKLELFEPTWAELVKEAHNKDINLQVSATSNPDSPRGYSVHGICAAEVILDVLTGTHQILRVDLTVDTGLSLNPALDIGQIEGAFVMGIGLWTSERLIYDSSGRLLTDRTWTYKPPGALDIPVDFRVNFKRDSYNNKGVLGSKAPGESATLLAMAVIHALQDAITEAAKEYGSANIKWTDVDTPYNIENIIMGIYPDVENYKLK